MAPIGHGHAAAVNALNRALVMACRTKATVSVQNPARLDRLNVPQPDFAVFRPRADFYATGEPPGPADVPLLVEVADSSLRYDTRVKLPLYARAGIAELWIVDLKRRALDAYRRPADGEYAEVATHRPGDRLALAAAPSIVVRLDFAFA
jgi:Uma2 family endonuclease